MSGRATLAMVVSSACISVASITEPTSNARLPPSEALKRWIMGRELGERGTTLPARGRGAGSP
ncbi:hypothetical protein [Pseudoxanthomonas sp.]|uniref:hypothetical protein n=1 Tax=Pseudoxanthomonas sp. TaxID=1871049 RepID=UPI00258984BE|nr:hypothetical protein [Pseudoxanthomonas sp.]MCR6685590.1 hypothetical protein [Pseudoxanthomonas sp.]